MNVAKLNTQSRQLIIWGGITCILALLIRWPTFFRATLSSDESTYLLMARQWLHNLSLYREIWDTKPPGIVILFASLFKLIGISLPALRVTTSLFHAIAVISIWQILYFFQVRTHPLVIILSSLLFLSTKTYSLSANTEIFFITFTLLSTLSLLHAKKWWHFIMAGLLLGTGFEIKYFVLFDFFALSLILLLQHTQQRPWKLFLFTLGFITPFFIILLYFYYSPMWEDFYYVTFIIPQKYSGITDWSNLQQFAWQYLRAPGVLLLSSFGLLLLKPFTNVSKDKILLLLISWVSLTTIATVIPKTFFGHYIMQIIPPTLILFFYTLQLYRNKLSTKITVSIVIIEVVVGLFITKNFYKKYIHQQDPELHIAQILKTELASNSPIFIATSGSQILYYLLNKDIPTKYIHPSLLYNLSRAKRLGIPAKQELHRIYNIPHITIISINDTPYDVSKTHKLEKSIRINNAKVLKIFTPKVN